MLIKFKVNKTHIKEGIKENADYCAVALCIKEKLSVEGVSVDGEEVHLATFACRIYRRVKLPAKVTEFIEMFDQGFKVNPIAFELDLPEGWLK